ncbi:DUF3488 and DUF4129 domain-containing transglutaminase family protein, partial [Candidatus Hydrogenedentota bacterium]
MPSLNLRLASKALPMTALLLMVSSIEFGWPLAGIGLVCLVLGMLSEELRWSPRIYRIISDLLGFLYFFVFMIDLRFAGAIALPGLRLLTFIQLVKMLAPRKNTRDYVVIIIVTVFMVLGSTTLENTPMFIPTFLAFVACLVWLFMALHFSTTQGRYAERPKVRVIAYPGPLGASSSPNKGLSGKVVYRLAVCLLVTYLLFLAFPRVHGGFLSIPEKEDPEKSLTGFSSEVDLQEFDDIAGDKTWVMDIEIHGTAGPLPFDSLYWRAGAMDEFNGLKWTKSSISRRRPTTEIMPTLPLVFEINPAIPAKNLLEFDVFMSREFTGSRKSVPHFMLQRTRSIKTPHTIITLDIIDRSVSMPIRQTHYDKPTYSFRANIEKPLPDELRAASVSDGNTEFVPRHEFEWSEHPTIKHINGMLGRMYLENGTSSSRIAGLTDKIIAEAQADTPYDRIVAIERYLTENFLYTLELSGVRPSANISPLEDFLFNSKKGHCQFFAAAQVIMMRHAEIPSRICVGYRGGLWNAVGKFYSVSESDAHTWAEAFFPNFGWVAFDPAPSPELESEDQAILQKEPGWLARLISYSKLLVHRRHLDALYYRHIVGYDKMRRKRLVEDICDYAVRTWTALRNSPEAIATKLQENRSARYVFAASVVMLCMGGYLAVRLARKKRARRSIASTDGLDRGAKGLTMCFASMVEALKRVGNKVKDGETPREFAARIGRDYPETSGMVSELTATYYCARYGRKRISET